MNVRLLVLLAMVGILAGCQAIDEVTLKRYPRNNAAGRAWLSDQVFPAEINVNGTWKSSDWGKAYLGQTGRAVNGYLGSYIVEGVVSGRKAYLLARDGDWYYYSIVLDMPAPDLLLGYYSKSIPYKSNNRRDIRLDRH